MSEDIETIEFDENSELIFIHQLAFCGCQFESISLPPSIRKIGEDSFNSCKKLKTFKFNENTEFVVIGSKAFSQTLIKSLTFPSGRVEFENNWCEDLNKLSEINIPQSNKQLMVYDDKYLLEKSNPEDKVYDSILFVKRNVKTVTIPPFIKKIKFDSFRNCLSLVEVNFSKCCELKSIEPYAFANSAIHSIRIPPSVTELGEKFVYYCKKLTKIEFDDNSKISSLNSYAFALSSFTSLSIPASVSTIDSDAFHINKLKIVEIQENSKLETHLSYVFKDKGIIIMIPHESRSVIKI